jgi:hypothetical protein
MDLLLVLEWEIKVDMDLKRIISSSHNPLETLLLVQPPQTIGGTRDISQTLTATSCKPIVVVLLPVAVQVLEMPDLLVDLECLLHRPTCNHQHQYLVQHPRDIRLRHSNSFNPALLHHDKRWRLRLIVVADLQVATKNNPTTTTTRAQADHPVDVKLVAIEVVAHEAPPAEIATKKHEVVTTYRVHLTALIVVLSNLHHHHRLHLHLQSTTAPAMTVPAPPHANHLDEAHAVIPAMTASPSENAIAIESRCVTSREVQ